MPRLCAFGCKTREAITHRFPIPGKFPEQFVNWVILVGGKLEKPSDYDYYAKKIICDKHFKDADKNRNNRLNKSAVPTLYLPEQKNLEILHGSQPNLSEPGSTFYLAKYSNGAPLQAALPPSNTGSDNVILHKFPSPVNELDRFRTWIYSIGGDVLSLENQFIHDYRKVCHVHFEEKHMTRSGRLSNIAVPTLYLKGNSSTEQPKPKSPDHDVVSDHSYSIKEKPEGNSLTSIETASFTPIDLKRGYDKQQLDFKLTEDGELIEADAFVNAESPPSSVPPSEIGETIDNRETEDENIYSWQKTELIVTDDPEDPTPAQVPEISKISEDDVVTLSLFCDPEPEGEVPSEPVLIPEDVEYRCNDCAVIIDGFSWWCVQCACGALCCACAQRAPHDAHYVLRAPLTATHSQTEAILAVVRQQLQKENLITLCGIDVSVKEEVKDELECPSSPAPPDPLAVELHPHPLAVEPHPDSLTEDILTTDDESVDEDAVEHHPFKRPRLMENTNSTVTNEDVQQQSFLYQFNIPKGTRTTVKVTPSTASLSGIKLIDCHKGPGRKDNTALQTGINDIARDNTGLQKSYLTHLQTPQKDQSNKLMTHSEPRGLQALQKIKTSEIRRPDIVNPKRALNVPKGLLNIQQINPKEPKLLQVPQKVLKNLTSLNVTSEVQLKDTVTNLDEVDEVVVEFLDEELLEYDSEENLDKDIVEHGIDEDSVKITKSEADDLGNNIIDRDPEDMDDSVSYIKNEAVIDKEYQVKENLADLIRNYTDSEVDDTDLDKDFRIDEEDRIEDSDETDVEDIIERGVGRRTRNNKCPESSNRSASGAPYLIRYKKMDGQKDAQRRLK